MTPCFDLNTKDSSAAAALGSVNHTMCWYLAIWHFGCKGLAKKNKMTQQHNREIIKTMAENVRLAERGETAKGEAPGKENYKM